MVTTGLFLDTRRRLKDNLYPLKLRITHNRKTRLYPLELHNTKIALTESKYTKILSVNPKGEDKILKNEISNCLQEVQEIIEKMDSFTFEKFAEIYKKNGGSKIKNIYDEKIEELQKKGQIKTAETYRYSLASLTKHDNNLTDFNDITSKSLQDYEDNLINNNKSTTTIGMYLRCLRAIYNLAIEKQIITKKNYPFFYKSYSIPKGNSRINMVIPHKKIIKLNNLKGLPPDQEMARDFWIFSLLCNGMNFKDIALLKYSNLEKDYFTFKRAKTIRTRTSNPEKLIQVTISKEVRNIIKKWGNKDQKPNNYVFPILTDGMKDKDQQIKIDNFIGLVNDKCKILAKIIGVKKLTTYMARHCYVSISIDKGANLINIKDDVGHTSVETTAGYVSSLSDQKAKRAKNLLKL